MGDYSPNGTFNGVTIGDYVTKLNISYSVDRQTINYVRADGAYIRNTGGGLETISIEAFKIFSDQATKDQYIQTLITSFGNASSTLIVDGVNYTNCFMNNISASEVGRTWITFRIEFIRNVH